MRKQGTETWGITQFGGLENEAINRKRKAERESGTYSVTSKGGRIVHNIICYSEFKSGEDWGNPLPLETRRSEGEH